MRPERRLAAVLFDLDGTLADTAPDLLGALERLRERLGLPAIDTRPLRCVVSRGAQGILEAGLPEFDEDERESHRAAFLDDYAARCWDASRPFDGVPETLDRLESLGLPWGVVTNKIARFAGPVVEAAGWQGRAGCLVAGDTVSRGKPAPDPVLHACRLLEVEPADTLFVGDDRRDIEAGRAAGTATAAALWGYVPDDEDPTEWRADLRLTSPAALMTGIADWQQRERA